MSAGRDLLLFILFLIALGIAWFFTGGPSRTASHSGWFLSGWGDINVPSVPLSGGASASSSSGTVGTPSNTWATNEPQQNSQSVWDYFFNYRAGTGAVALPDNSPYAKYVYFSGGGTSASDPGKEYVTIRTNGQLPGTVTITGWQLQSAQSGLQVSIGNAAPIPFLGGLNSQAPVTLGPNSTAIIVTGSSPNGVSFRLNKCTGYFSQFQSFTPSLTADCPTPENEMLAHPELTAGNQTCQNFIETLPRCKITLSSIPGAIGGLCQNFVLNTLSYNGCISAHQQDPDFYRNEWRIYLGRSQELWNNKHDAIRLLDENGKLVGQVSY